MALPSPSAVKEPDPRWRLYHRSQDAWQAMEADCAAARISIECEMYIFENDALGRRFLRLFWRKAGEGVAVRLLFDSIGSWNIRRSLRLKVLRRRGVSVAFFNPVNGWRALRPASLLPRTHAKVMLIDSRLLHIGGVCIDGRMRRWRDTHIRVLGKVAAEAAASLDHLWRRFIGIPVSRPVENREPLRPEGFRFATSLAGTRKNLIYREVVRHVRGAKVRVRLMTPYFIPGRMLFRLIKQQARRGIQVELIVSEASDVRLADWVALSYFPSLVRAGVHVYRYLPSVMHAKVVMVDDDWATLGSMNLDHLSLFRNREANLLITDRAAVGTLNAQFDADLAQCRLATARELLAVPPLQRLVGRIGRGFKGFL
ncbi:MAG: phosphatidylserine/phosphatidylglycerophosphate/cardiolipin synthase family protein [Alphaproteobacteria bacterium]|nr:phosphatidylserine/phosphatidylglycerophosphate/cardiolipin synthase family protein [Alphaproteobacteria bacterium]